MGVQEDSLVRREEPHKLAAHDLNRELKSTAVYQTAPTPSVTYTVDTHDMQLREHFHTCSYVQY